jgi:hypothetical protein
MMKRIVGVLLLANLALFGWMRWGETLTVDAGAPALQAALRADKIRLLDWSTASVPAASAAPGLPLALSPLPAPVPPSAPVVAAPVAAAAAKTSPQTSNCAEWGEFSGLDLMRARQALGELKLGDSLTQRGVEYDRGYWVYMPPQKTRADVERKIAQLKERGVNDYFVVQEEGEWHNAISLGVFRTEDAAQKFLATLRKQRVRTARVGERMSKLRFTVFVMKGLDAGGMGRIEALHRQFPGSELKVSACNN